MGRLSLMMMLVLPGWGLCFAQAPGKPAPSYRLQASFPARHQDIGVELLALDPGQPADDEVPTYQVWLVNRAQRNVRKLLYSGNWPARAQFTEDGYYFVVERATGRETGDLVVYRRIEGMRYEEVEGVMAKLWEFCTAQVPAAAQVDPGARLAKFVRWSGDGSALLAELTAGGPHGPVREWLAVIELAKLQPTLDLNLLNRGWPQTVNSNGADPLAGMEFKATERAHERLVKAYELMTIPSGGEELVPQPGDPIPPRGTPNPRETLGKLTPTRPEEAKRQPPQPRKLRVSADGSALLYALLVPGDAKTPSREWFCVYDMTSGRPTFDLAAINRGATSDSIPTHGGS